MAGHAIHIKLDGRTCSGTYKVHPKMLTVKTTYGMKSAGISSRRARETLAHQLLLDQQELSRKGSAL